MIRAAIVLALVALACAASAGSAPGYVASANRICAEEHARFTRAAGAIHDSPAGYVHYATVMRPTITRLHARLGALRPPRASRELHRYLLQGIDALGGDLDDLLAANRRRAGAVRLTQLMDRFLSHASAYAKVAVALKLPDCILT